MNSMNASTLATYIIGRANQKGDCITNLKLQKILYYIQGYSFKFFHQPAFEEKIFNWDYGATVPVVFFFYSMYGSNSLKTQVSPDSIFFPSDVKRLYDGIIDSCLDMTTKDIVNSMLKELPCQKTGVCKEIWEEDIRVFFADNNPLKLNFSQKY